MEKLSAQELKLLQSKNPEQYIENSIKSKLPSGRKAYMARLWMDKTGYSVEDIQRARNRNPYWKEKKMNGSPERNYQRRIDHDYSRGRTGAAVWDEETIKEFIALNKKDKAGRYIRKDFELAKHFKSTIAAIQHYRRKHNMTIRILDASRETPSVKKVYDYICMSEQILRTMLKQKGGKKR
ncbi:MAG: hypothetical protein EPN93_16280 [Spirochaetes bacterium]|nr:MAG: hypothetical protein EPN93_16280 [Spirochaetota bacterium]